LSVPDEDTLRVVLVDDEQPAREYMRSVLDELPAVRVVSECPDGPAAIDAIRREAPDLVLLDVQMPEVSGFDVVAAVGAEAMPEVVFVTAHDEYALQAFEVHALDYVLKPFTPARLADAVRQARRRIVGAGDEALEQRLTALLAEHVPAPAGTEARWVSRLTVRTGERIRFVRVADVDWIEAARNYVWLHSGASRHAVRIPLQALAKRLDPAQFVRIHRSAIVNLDRVREVQAWVGGEYVALLHDGRTLRVSRGFRDALLALMH
jgi:two-component system LytT family response regulator